MINFVYEAVRKNKQTWESTLLLITYDEHGGLYDHVAPPETVNPGDKPIDSTIFDFKRLGVRVPAVLVSPFIEKGTIIHDVFDHTSIIATARKLFIPEWEKFPLTERDRNARTFEGFLNLSSPRTDKVKFPKATNVGPSTFAASATTSRRSARAASAEVTHNMSTGQLSEFQQVMVFQAVMADKFLPGDTVAAQVTSMSGETDAARYLEKIRNVIEASRNGALERGKTAARKKARKATAVKTTKKKAAKKR